MNIIVVYTDEISFDSIKDYSVYVTPRRRRSIEKRRREQSKTAALVSELLVISQLSKMTGIPFNKIRFDYGSYGKPYLKQGGAWFSVSHTMGAVCAAFALENEGEIGVDIEPVKRQVKQNLYNRVLSLKERSLTRSPEDFIRFWVMKEAFLKRTGVGISRDLRGVETSVLPDTKALLYGDYFIGVSGKNAENLIISTMNISQLVSNFVAPDN